MPASKNSLLCFVSSVNAIKISFLNVYKYSRHLYFSQSVGFAWLIYNLGK